jgi:hypothetical protein
MTQNENSPRFDLTTYLPIGVGIISLFGICLLLIASRLAAPRAIVEVPDTATPFSYLLIGTEPGIATIVPTVEFIGTREVGFAVTAYSGISGSGDSSIAEPTQQRPAALTPADTADDLLTLMSPTRTLRPALTTATNTPISLPSVPGSTTSIAPTSTRQPTLTSTSVGAPPLNAGTYDDTDSHLTYNGDWISQANVSGAQNGTLHVSQTLGNTITFRFIGDQLRIVFQSGAGLGVMAAAIDGVAITPPLNQSAAPPGSSEWVIPGLTNATHLVVVTHSSGGSINIDQVIVPNVAPTATSTFTPTSTSSP